MKYWLISAPGDKTKQQTWQKLNDKTAVQNSYSINFKFDIPDLKVGTLDSLIVLSDELSKVDTFTEALVHKLVQNLATLLEKPIEEIVASPLINGTTIENYLTLFHWDEAKYPIRSSVRDLCGMINKQVTDIDSDTKSKMSAFNNLKNNLATFERKQTGNLLIRDLAEFVKKEDFVQSEYLTTVLVVIPKYLYKEWQQSYESITSYVVPRSSKKIAEDSEFGLFTTTLFRRVEDEFRNLAREKRFIVREFVFDEAQFAETRREREQLQADVHRQLNTLVRWTTTYLGEAFTCWVHLKAIRVFVESVLRYGLPPNFQAILLQPVKSKSKRLREILQEMFGHLGGERYVAKAGDVVPEEVVGTAAQQEFFPYVSTSVNIEFSSTK